jgi:hypothetical protein|tara:strand:- start:205 stop:756 length:552 start_codon:yes stop_codon:yes gene_type:complete
MSFEITSMSYDAQRQLPKTNNFSTAVAGSTTQRAQFFTSVPYDMTFDVNIYAKSQDDALQMVEQILPYFNPQYTVTVKPFSADYPEIKEDIPVTLQSVSFSDDFEGSVGDRRTIIYTLAFGMKISFMGPQTNKNVIREVNNNLYTIGADSDVFLTRMQTTPTPNGISVDSDYGFNLTYLDSAS